MVLAGSGLGLLGLRNPNTGCINGFGGVRVDHLWVEKCYPQFRSVKWARKQEVKCQIGLSMGNCRDCRRYLQSTSFSMWTLWFVLGSTLPKPLRVGTSKV